MSAEVTSVDAIKPMTTEMLEGLRVIELNWHDKHRFIPPVGFKLYTALQNDSFRRALTNRGIRLPKSSADVSSDSDENSESKGLQIPDFPYDADITSITQQQTAAVLTVVNFADKRSRNIKLRDLGISVSTWSGWLKDEAFRNFYFSQATKQFGDALPIAQEALVRAMESGKVEGIKYFMELIGKGPTSTEASGTNVRLVIQKLVEVLQLHIQDPDILGAIGLDFDRVLKGESPVGPQNALLMRGVI